MSGKRAFSDSSRAPRKRGAQMSTPSTSSGQQAHTSDSESATGVGATSQPPLLRLLGADPFELPRALGNERFSRLVANESSSSGGARSPQRRPHSVQREPNPGAPTPSSNSQSLPSSAEAAHRTLGGAASNVRIHTGASADSALAARPDAMAVTLRNDIFVGRNAPSLDSPGGRLLLAHESAHVVQQSKSAPTAPAAAHNDSAELSRSSETEHSGTDHAGAEHEADQVAVGATLGHEVSVNESASGPQFFEARWHQASLTGAMNDSGFTGAEQEAAYFGNWCRDLSQAFVPMASSTIGTTGAFELVNLLAMHHFGHGVTPSQLGAYDPRQHIDNPAGTTDRDILGHGVDVSGFSGPDPITGEESGHAGIDSRSEGELSPSRIAESFAVNAAGVPAYITRSKEYIVEEATAALDAGRTEAGLFHVGNFSHTCEDLFAHSNWIEIAIGRLLQEGTVTLPPGDTNDEVTQRLAANRPPVENFSADVADQAGRARPILSTGTFSGGGAGNDTVMSIKAEAQNLLRDREPFKEDGSGGGEMYDFALEVLKHAQDSAAEGSIGQIFADVVQQALGNLGGAAVGAIDNLPGADGRPVDGRFGELIGGATSLLSGAAHTVADATSGAWQATLRPQVASIVNRIAPTALTLGEALVWVKSGAGQIGEAWNGLKEAVRELPESIKEILLPKLVQAERDFKKKIRDLANAAYGTAIQTLVDGLEGLAPLTDTAETNVDQKLDHWRVELDGLRSTMQTTLLEVGGPDGAALAAQVAGMEPEALIGFAESAQFHAVLNGLVGNAAAQARLTAAATALDDKGNQVAQLENVPAWARAGASHSQTAKDHDDGAFFGIAFNVARQADGTLMGLLQQAWAEQGDVGPAAGLETEYGTLDATGELPEEEGVSDAERGRRQTFLKTRAAGEHVVREGRAENVDIGPRLVALADGLEQVVRSYPGADFVLRNLISVLRSNPEAEALLDALQAARQSWENYAGTGQLDDDLMRAVDSGLAAVSRAAGVYAHTPGDDHHDDNDHHDEHEHPTDHSNSPGVDTQHPRESDSHHHGDRTEVFFQQQIDELDRYRRNSGANERVRGRSAGTTVTELNEAVRLSGGRPGEKRAAEAADAISEPRERLFAEIDRIFGHPYDSNWWVPTVAAWCRAHPDVLERSVRDRNHGVAHSHAH